MEVVGETRKCEWPAKDELIQSTGVVVVFLLLLAVFVGVCCDRVLVVIMERILAIRW